MLNDASFCMFCFHIAVFFFLSKSKFQIKIYSILRLNTHATPSQFFHFTLLKLISSLSMSITTVLQAGKTY